jgi:hypothetical protein
MSSTISVYTPGFASVVNLPLNAVSHLPQGPSNRLVLCANYSVSNPSSCAMGSTCRFVHADTRAAKSRPIHVNYAWRSVAEIEYECFPPGQVLRVAPPNSKIASDVMNSELVLKTKALTSQRRPLSHCAHYYFNRTCNMGPDCQFVHAVFIDPTAKLHQRAPVPSQLGEGRELQLSKKQREAMRSAQHHDETSSVATPPESVMGYNSSEPSTTPRSHPAAPVSAISSLGASHAGQPHSCRYRFNPYSTLSPKLILCPA